MSIEHDCFNSRIWGNDRFLSSLQCWPRVHRISVENQYSRLLGAFIPYSPGGYDIGLILHSMIMSPRSSEARVQALARAPDWRRLSLHKVSYLAEAPSASQDELFSQLDYEAYLGHAWYG